MVRVSLERPGLAVIDRFLPPRTMSLGIVAHPRCGSTYAASLAQRCGLDIGHECEGTDGISSWMFVADDIITPFGTGYGSAPANCKFTVTALCLRDPFAAASSIIIENRVTDSFRYRRSHIQAVFGFDLLMYENALDRAMASYLFWNKLAELRTPDLVFRIEDEGDRFEMFLRERFPLETTRAPIAGFTSVMKNEFSDHYGPTDVELKSPDFVNWQKPELRREHWMQLSSTLRGPLKSFCEAYGYEWRLP